MLDHKLVLHCNGIGNISLWLDMMMVAASTSDVSVNLYQSAWHNIPEDGCLFFS
jgi:hypothetical protein